ncbi:SLAM family member 6 isoform X2 [Tupaia chinensis]|uniref:SLAM family member 6 isoform X2 n=1 Tax=Tupaia chinensis TaxID=246437 RepID=UPI000FFB46CA|nr:SLAM family member 6 isoform X2 [Tupaia chinensis]
MFWLFHSLSFIFCLSSGNAVSQPSSTPVVVNGTLGKSVTFPLEFPTGGKPEDITSIIVLHSGRSIAFINPREAGRAHVTDPKWKTRLNFIYPDSVQLHNLTMADAGPYSTQMSTENSTWLSSYILRIFRQLKNIQVTNHTQWSENGTCEIQLACWAENSDNDSFKWQAPGMSPLNGPNLTASWDPRNSSEQNYTCNAENPISNLSFSVSAQRLCEDVTKNQHSNFIRITIPVMIIIVIIVCAVLYCVWRKKRGSHHVSSQQTQSPGEHPDSQLPDIRQMGIAEWKRKGMAEHLESVRNVEYASVSIGNTVYAQVSHPKRETEIPTPVKNNDSVTIYSTINNSKESKPISSRPTALDNVV